MITELTDISLKRHHTFGIDVKCRRWVEYTSTADLAYIYSQYRDGRIKAIGEGANLLFSGDFEGTLIHSRILDIDSEMLGNGRVLLKVGSGMNFDDLVAYTVERGLWGLENLSGIPGQVGASAVQNIGAYGVEAKDLISRVYFFDTQEGMFGEMDADECQYGYRSSFFKQPENRDRYVITYVDFVLSTLRNPHIEYGNLRSMISADPEEVTAAEIREAVMQMRNSKLPDPAKVGSAGSFFMNPVVGLEDFERVQNIARKENGDDYNVPHYTVDDAHVKIPAAWLIERCGWKGRTVGNAGVWHLQPLVLTNATGDACADEIIALYEAITADVDRKFGIRLQRECEQI